MARIAMANPDLLDQSPAGGRAVQQHSNRNKAGVQIHPQYGLSGNITCNVFERLHAPTHLQVFCKEVRIEGVDGGLGGWRGVGGVWGGMGVRRKKQQQG